ncbi:MAG: hypothetical protein KJ856_00345 [Gammaproteobacteria bacterium]|nr:hypothetical protein [Gammaproteobacteria bacterium]MBU1479708.1 hypothetical protein [Gammaproteobacteria bacterium]MBU1999714.1 hypothetical protein [Gammaproteobacteria bacterium]MBU2133103.1 hypothetical protein [Gammaproteobacteria bacterium]MBU2185479.1 hypothetical protein [Gammaproteobacteria bacterium]
MNWARIAKYTVVYFICSTASGVPLGYVIGRYDSAGEMIPSWIYWSFIFLSMVVEATIIFFLVKNQAKFAFIHALIVVLLSSLIASFILFLMAGEVLLGGWQIDYASMSIALLFGVALGKQAAKVQVL